MSFLCLSVNECNGQKKTQPWKSKGWVSAFGIFSLNLILVVLEFYCPFYLMFCFCHIHFNLHLQFTEVVI